MWRTRAVIAMLVEDIAGLALPADRESEADKGGDPPELASLSKAIRRGRLVIVVDWIAIAILFLFRDPSRPFLPVNQTVETVFTLGVLAIAAHAGFRWGQIQRYQAVERLCDELHDRQD
jgi:hypothetical protein